MATPAYDIGDLRRLSVTFSDIDGTEADPTTVTFKMREPDGTETIYAYGTDAELVKDGVGRYHVDWTLTQAGRHVVRWEGTGVVATAEQVELYGRRKEGVS